MGLRADFGHREVVRSGGEAWRPSPMADAEYYALDRIGNEVARETSIVRCATGARFNANGRSQGQEFLVLAGSLHDDAGDYLDGTYVRNPVGTAHPCWAGPDGATLFVKLRQFAATDTQRVVIDTRAARWRQGLILECPA
jgi:anti-sigma factor ChrR (cupin superfamily)